MVSKLTSLTKYYSLLDTHITKQTTTDSLIRVGGYNKNPVLSRMFLLKAKYPNLW